MDGYMTILNPFFLYHFGIMCPIWPVKVGHLLHNQGAKCSWYVKFCELMGSWRTVSFDERYGLLQGWGCFLFEQFGFFLSPKKTWVSKKSSTKRGSLLQRWHCCVLISRVRLWLHWCRHGEGVAFRNLQWRFPDEGKLLHVKLNLFYVVEPFFDAIPPLIFNCAKSQMPFSCWFFKTITLLANVWSHLKKSLKVICCIHVYTLMIFWDTVMLHVQPSWFWSCSQGDQLCATYSLQTGRETTSLEAKPKDNILHHLGKLKHCTYIV